MIRILILSLFLVSTCYADVVFHRFTDKATGEERGISYSGNDGTPSVNNPEWNVEVMPEDKKDYYIKEHNKQIKQKEENSKKLREEKAKRIRTKLKDLGISESDLNDIIK